MILVFGKTGQVAMELQRFGGVTALGRADVDLSNPQTCADVIYEHRPRAVINAAAFTAVDKAEEEEALATIINGYAPTVMARACAQLAIPFIHISTDYVFNGAGETPWHPKGPTAPKNAYGRSKLLGEIGIIDSGAVFVILRTSWVISAHGTNFLNSMLRLSETCDTLSIVADQIGGPTPAHDISAACLQVAEQLIQDVSKSGTYHFSGAPDVSWADFATEIFDQIGKSVTIIPISTDAYPRPAARPLNSRMDCKTTERVFGILRPCWKAGLNKILKDRGA